MACTTIEHDAACEESDSWTCSELASECEYCAYMRSVALPDHEVEVRMLAIDESGEYWPDDWQAFIMGVMSEFDTLGDHDAVSGHWPQKAFVRRHTLARANVATMREFQALREETP